MMFYKPFFNVGPLSKGECVLVTDPEGPYIQVLGN